MESRWLEDFLSLVDTRNFSRSAEARFTTQPAFSRRIKNLEVERGQTSFSIPILRKNITTFYNGWLSYINGLRNAEEIRKHCTDITENYLQTLN